MSKELYIGHISDNAFEEDIRTLFSVMGTVTSVHLIIDPVSGEFKHCGYVKMAGDVNLNEVVQTLDGALLVDKVITVSIARPQKPGMSKSGGAGRFKGPRKPGFMSRTAAAPQARPERKSGEGPKTRGAGTMSPTEARVRPEWKPGDGPKTRGTGPKSSAEARVKPEWKSGDGPKPRGGAKTSTGARSGAAPTSRAEPKPGRGQKPSERPTRETNRTTEPKRRRP